MKYLYPRDDELGYVVPYSLAGTVITDHVPTDIFSALNTLARFRLIISFKIPFTMKVLPLSMIVGYLVAGTHILKGNPYNGHKFAMVMAMLQTAIGFARLNAKQRTVVVPSVLILSGFGALGFHSHRLVTLYKVEQETGE